MSDDNEDNPVTAGDMLRSLPAHLSTQARLTFLFFWEDAGRCYGPADISAPALMQLTSLSRTAQQNAIRELRAAGLLSEASRYPTAPGLWFRWVMPPQPRMGAPK